MTINGHRTRIAMGASSYDEICIKCGATDGLGTLGGLARPCPVSDEHYAREQGDQPREPTPKKRQT